MDPLHKLRCLNQSSPEFPDQLTSLLYKYGYRDYVANLRDLDSKWLVEYLDNVSLPCYLPRLTPKTCPGPQYPSPHQSCVPKVLA